MRTTIHTGDCRDVMRALEPGSFTAIVSDPPYGLSFMGKEWDHGVPGVEFWAEALRVLKPGGMLLAFGGTRTYHRLTCAIEDAGFEVRDCLSWLYGSGFPKSLDISKAIDRQRHDGAQVREVCRWEGYGTALKPAWEPIVLAMKPTAGTFASNAQAHGVAGVNVDGCRIGTETLAAQTAGVARLGTFERTDMTTPERVGRWPANVMLDEDAAAELDEQTGTLTSGKAPASGFVRSTDKHRNTLGKFEGQRVEPTTLIGDSGGASRFFYTSKARSAERHGSNGAGGRATTNTHPTLKPLDLMQWLCRLVKMPTGTRILDPFCGSGTTLLAAAREGIESVGIELDPAHVEIARARFVEDAPMFNQCEVHEALR